ncbi:unnamed protein product, partial [Iphiclides podalirius]
MGHLPRVSHPVGSPAHRGVRYTPAGRKLFGPVMSRRGPRTPNPADAISGHMRSESRRPPECDFCWRTSSYTARDGGIFNRKIAASRANNIVARTTTPLADTTTRSVRLFYRRGLRRVVKGINTQHITRQVLL